MDGKAAEYSHDLKPSARGEIEITFLLNKYMELGQLEVTPLSRGTAWLDTGTTRSMMDAQLFIQIMEERTGLKIGCPEEVAWRMGFITDAQLAVLAENLSKSDYGKYLQAVLAEGRS